MDQLRKFQIDNSLLNSRLNFIKIGINISLQENAFNNQHYIIISVYISGHHLTAF